MLETLSWDAIAISLANVDVWIWVVGAVGLIAAFLVGRFSAPDRSEHRERAALLEGELGRVQGQLAEARESLESQQQAVEKHFEQTSDLFGDLTRQYTALYSHLAEGARSFCPESRPALGQGFGAALLANATADSEDEEPFEEDAVDESASGGDDLPEPEAEPEEAVSR